MQFAPGGLWSQGWPVCTTCHLPGLHFSAQNVSRTETWPWCLQWYEFCSREMTEKGHYFCSDTCIDVSWEELLKTVSWNDAKLMWERSQTVCIMHVGSLTGGACLPFHTCLICAVPGSSLEFMRVHVHITDSAYCRFQGYDLPRTGYTVCSRAASYNLLVCLCQLCVHINSTLLWPQQEDRKAAEQD